MLLSFYLKKQVKSEIKRLPLSDIWHEELHNAYNQINTSNDSQNDKPKP